MAYRVAPPMPSISPSPLMRPKTEMARLRAPAVGAQPVGHKQGVGQDVAGQAQRAQHIQAHILEKAPLHSDPS